MTRAAASTSGAATPRLHAAASTRPPPPASAAIPRGAISAAPKRRKSGSGSSSDSTSESESSHERKRARKSKNEKREKQERHEKREKKRKKGKKRKKHSSRARDEGEPVQRSIITGKRIKRTEGSVADADGEARRAQVLARINGDEAAGAFAKQPKSEAELLRERARFDPALMKELMVKGQQAQREREGRRGKPMVSEARQAYLANVLVVQREQGLR